MKSGITLALLASVLVLASQSVMAQAQPPGAELATEGSVGGISTTTLVLGALAAAVVVTVVADSGTTGTISTK